VAIAASYQTTVTNITSNVALWTSPTTGYQRDLVITNGGPSLLYVVAGTAATTAAAATGFAIPTGGTVVLTECGLTNATKVFGFSPGTASCYIGYGTNVAVV
jgi:hypothetical protein